MTIDEEIHALRRRCYEGGATAKQILDRERHIIGVFRRQAVGRKLTLRLINLIKKVVLLELDRIVDVLEKRGGTGRLAARRARRA